MVSNVDVLTTAEEAYKKLNSSGNTPNTNDILTGTDKSLSDTKNTSPKTIEGKSLKGYVQNSENWRHCKNLPSNLWYNFFCRIDNDCCY